MQTRRSLLRRVLDRVRSLTRRAPDTAWKPTGIRQIYAGYDADKAAEATRRAEARRKLQRELDGRLERVERLDRRPRS